MRNSFVDTLLELATSDPQLCLITGDLGYNVLNRFYESFPERYINAGIAEQLMTSMATGMALAGKSVYTYSLANFPSLRCLEQIRNDICYHNCNVTIVSVGAGFGYGSLGMSHHATEDVAIMRALPNMIVCSPGDPWETVAATRLLHQHGGPAFLRLGKGGEPRLHATLPQLAFGKGLCLIEGSEVAIVSNGPILSEAYKACQLLNADGISCALYSLPFVKPLDTELIEKLARSCVLIVSVEEHSIIGGFSGAVAEHLAGLRDRRAIQIRIGLQDRYSSIVGDQAYLRQVYEMDHLAIYNKTKAELAIS